MSEQPEQHPEPGAPARPRLGPRPLDRPDVDPGQAAAFARPSGVTSAFSPRSGVNGTNGSHGAANGFALAGPPPPESLVSAFGRPAGDTTVLQRPPDEAPAEDAGEAAYWAGDDGRDPWRDPGAGAVLGPPAVAEQAERDAKDTAKPAGPLLSIPELLFGRRVKPTALGVLVLVALLVGAVGGVTGWAIGNGGHSLTDAGTTLTQADPGVERAPDSVAGVVSRVAPAVVSLEVQAGTGGDVGSGVVIDGGGYILTNNHVVASAASGTGGKITAVFSTGKRIPASIVGRDPVTDLAVLKVDATGLTVLKLGTSGKLQPGDPVIAIGSPLGLAGTVTSGIVSAVHRPFSVPGEDGGPNVTYDAIQIDAAINPGNSGGALVDSSGTLIGINSAIQTFASGSDAQGGSIGLGFAIPIDQAKKVAEQLIQTGSYKHANAGWNVRSVSATTSEGAQVVNVVQGGPAAPAGLAEGDVVTKFGDRAISTAEDLQVAVMDDNPGQSVPVVFDRQGQQHTVALTLGSD
jgi:S1-C subfamily serine protease